MEKVKVVGEGNTAKVIYVNEKTVAKVFHEHVSSASINSEFELSKIVMESGLPVPAVFQCDEIHGKHAILYERIAGFPLTNTLMNKPWKAKQLMNQMASIHVMVHENQSSALPSQKRTLHKKLERVTELSDEEKSYIKNHLERLPDGNTICHGDFHPDNILNAEKGLVIIDWNDAVRGNRIADVARTFLILQHGGIGENHTLLKLRIVLFFRKYLANQYLKSYQKHFPVKKESLQHWLLPVAAARLCEKLPKSEKDLLLKMIKNQIRRTQNDL